MERLNKEGLRYYTSLILGLIHQGSGNVARITEQQIQDLFGEAKVYEIRYWTANNQLLNLEENVELPDGWVHHGYSEGYGLVTSTVPIETFLNVFTLQPDLTQISLPAGVTRIGDEAFSRCYSLTSITIPNSVTSIGQGAFYKCTSLTSITIPESVTSIEHEAFFSCSFLASITCKSTTPPTLDSSNQLSNVEAVYVPTESVETYKTATNWSYYSSVIQPIPES